MPKTLLSAGVDETLTLSRQRGAKFLEPEVKRGEKRKPVRRLTGLQWLHRKGRITDDQLAAGGTYGALYRAATVEATIRSNLNQATGGTADRTASINRQIRDANRRVNAAERLHRMRGALGHNGRLIDALNRIAGQELTPREASPNGTEAATLEVLTTVALELVDFAFHRPTHGG